MFSAHPNYSIGDIVQTRFGNKSFVIILKTQDVDDRFLVRYVKSKHGVPIRKGRIFFIHEFWFKKYEWKGDKRRYAHIGWIPPINKESECL